MRHLYGGIALGLAVINLPVPLIFAISIYAADWPWGVALGLGGFLPLLYYAMAHCGHFAVLALTIGAVLSALSQWIMWPQILLGSATIYAVTFIVGEPPKSLALHATLVIFFYGLFNALIAFLVGLPFALLHKGLTRN